MNRIVSCLVFFVISILPLTAEGWSLNQKTGLSGSVYFTRSGDAVLLPQTGESFIYRLSADWSGGFSLIVSAGVNLVQPSLVYSGYFYRGYTGLDAALSLTVSAADTAADHPASVFLRPGIAAGFGISSNKYQFSEHYFFSAGLQAEPFLDFVFPERGGALSLSLGLPLAWYFRKETAVHFSAGIGIMLKTRISPRQETSL